MDQQIGLEQLVPPDQQVASNQNATQDQQAAPKEQRTARFEQQASPIEQRTASNVQQTAYEQEPMSDQFQPIHPDEITQEGNEAYLQQHQRHLRSAYPSCDLSEISYHTEHTDFAGSRHSSLNTEPLTLDAEQIHDAKDQAVDALQKESAFNLFTKDTLKTIFGRVSMMEYYWRQGQDSPTKSEEPLLQETEARADQTNASVERPQSSYLEEETSSEDAARSLEDEVNLRAD